MGLTRSEGADKGEPDKYYPSGKRTYGRVVPADHIQAAAQVAYQKDQGCTKVYILNDKEVYGKGIADAVQKARHRSGHHRSLGNDGIDTKAANFRSLATKIKSKGADCMFFGGITDNKAVQVWKDVGAANPTIKLFGPDGVAESAFTTKVPASLQTRTFITNPTLDPKLYPPAAQDFFKTYKAKYGEGPGAVRDLRLRGDAGRPAVDPERRRQGQRPPGRHRSSSSRSRTATRCSGKYSIDANGDTTLSDYGGDKVEGRQARVRQGHQGPDAGLDQST